MSPRLGIDIQSAHEYAQWVLALGGSLWGLVRSLASCDETRTQNAETVECHDYVLDSISDADRCARIERANGRDIREQLSVADAIEMRHDAELRRRWPHTN